MNWRSVVCAQLNVCVRISSIQSVCAWNSCGQHLYPNHISLQCQNNLCCVFRSSLLISFLIHLILYIIVPDLFLMNILLYFDVLTISNYKTSLIRIVIFTQQYINKPEFYEWNGKFWFFAILQTESSTCWIWPFCLFP